jgi:hypothetical protein
VALSPAACNRPITSDQHDPSANRPCTSTTLRALTGAAPAAVVRLAEISDAAAPATRAVENVRLFIIMIILFRRRVGMLFGWHGCSRTASGVEVAISAAHRRLTELGRVSTSSTHAFQNGIDLWERTIVPRTRASQLSSVMSRS